MAVAFTEEMKMPRIIERRELGLAPAFVVPSEELFQTFMPWTIQPLSPFMQISSFMDREGKIHFEFNHSTFETKKYLTWRALLRPQHYYEGLVKDFLKTSLIGTEKELIAGGHVIYDFEKRECHLLNLVILPRRLCPNVDPGLRKRVIFLLQEAFDQMVVRMGGVTARTETLVIPHEKMVALGWNLLKFKGFKLRWRALKEWWPVSLRGLQRCYVRYPRNSAKTPYR